MRLARVLVIAMLAGAGCSSGQPGTEPPSAAFPSASLAGPTTAAVPSESPDLVGAADAACRSSPFGDDLGTLTISASNLTDLVTIVYTDPDGDAVCQHSPQLFGEFPIVQRADTHLADQLTADTPMVRDSNASWSSQSGSYVWGAVGPVVASVVIQVFGTDQRIAAQIADGYFLAVIDPTVQCCVVTAVALDANGQEVAQAE